MEPQTELERDAMNQIQPHPSESKPNIPAMRFCRVLAALVICAVWMVLWGCTSPSDAPPDPNAQVLEKKVERGPVTVVTRLDRKEITIAERVNFTIEVTADEAYEVQLPRFGDKLEQFGIVDYATSDPKLVEAQRVMTARTYVLEPFLSGEYTIPPMHVSFWERDAGEEAKHEIETEALTIQVTSLLPETFEDLSIHDIAPPVGLPRSVRTLLWIALIGTLALAGGLTGFFIWRARHRPATPEEIRIRAHERAFAALEALVADDLIGKGQLKRFYQRISGILRQYIEDRFGLHAPEQTTQEFLHALGASDDLRDAYRDLLRDFLTHCDLVKFAEHQPTTDEIQNTFDSCKRFIVETQENTNHPET